jgi:cell wall-associated NlpC family hydrolase
MTRAVIACAVALLLAWSGTASALPTAAAAPTAESNLVAGTRSVAATESDRQRANAATPKRLRALHVAETQRGKRYCWGGSGPSCYDCSGLVAWAYGRVGIRLPHNTVDMLDSGRLRRTSERRARAGDLVFWGDYHVEFFVKPGESFGAHHGGTLVGFRAIWGSPTYWHVIGA